jgi:DNA-binding GntR family transcriptional regulator
MKLGLILQAADTHEEQRLPQRAYLVLRQSIRTLRLAPGQMVREREVVEALGMSRTPVREALVRLEAEGWVQIIPRHGFLVNTLASDDLQEMYEIVEGLDGVATALATARNTAETLSSLEAMLQQQAEALDRDDLVEWAELDDAFHLEIVRLSGNARLHDLIENFNDQLYRARLYTIHLRPRPTRSVEEHRYICEAMCAGEAERALLLMQAHRRRARAEILEIIRALNPQ